jgi:FAD-dependent oxidoreductase family protein
MVSSLTTVHESGSTTPIVARSDVVIVGGGPSGTAAAISAARNGASVTLLERYPYLGGLASGGMVLVLDDMTNGDEITVKGICQEFIDRLSARGLAVFPPAEDRRIDWAMWRKWSRWGVHDFHAHTKPHPITYAASFDPDGWKRVSDELMQECKVNLRLHSWFSRALVEDGRITGVVCETKAGRQAIMGDVVIDATGDLDVAVSAGARHISGSYILTTVFRLGGVDTDAAERFQFERPDEFQAMDKEAKKLIGGSWDMWWLKTPLPGIVWCNCPHMVGFDGTKVEDLTAAEFEGRRRIHALVDYLHRMRMPGFAACHVVDVAPQTGVRQTRLLEGEYVVTKDDIAERVHFADSVARGRDYYTPYRAMLPVGVDQLIVAGRHYSATTAAQKISREIPPCMAMGEAAGIAATLALEGGTTVRKIDVAALQRKIREQGGDPGDIPAANARLEQAAE